MIHTNYTALTLRAMMSPWRLDCLADVTDFLKLFVDDFKLFIVKLQHRFMKSRSFFNNLFALWLWEGNLALRSSWLFGTAFDDFSIGSQKTLALWLQYRGRGVSTMITRGALGVHSIFQAYLICFEWLSCLVSLHFFLVTRLVLLVDSLFFFARDRVIQVFGDVGVPRYLERFF